MKIIPEKEIFKLLTNFDGQIGLLVQDLNTNQTFTLNKDLVFPAASTIKIPLLVYLLKKVEDGILDWNTPILIEDHNRVSGTGILCELDKSIMLSPRSLTILMITLSDNTATNQIIDLVGLNEFNLFLKNDLHLKDTVMMRKMLDFDAIKKGKNNYTSANEMGNLLIEIANGKLISQWVCDEIINIMSKQQFRNKLPAFIPAVPSWASEEDKQNLKDDTVLVSNKTGDLTGIQHDIGIFRLPDNRKYIIAAFTKNLKQDSDGVILIGKISQLIYESLK